MERNIFDTLDEAIEDIEGGEYSGPQVAALRKEEGDDDIGLAGNINLSSDVTGAVEIHRGDEESDDDERSNDGNGQSKWKRNKKKWRNGVRLFDVNWYKNNDISYVILYWKKFSRLKPYREIFRFPGNLFSRMRQFLIFRGN